MIIALRIGHSEIDRKLVFIIKFVVKTPICITTDYKINQLIINN